MISLAPPCCAPASVDALLRSQGHAVLDRAGLESHLGLALPLERWSLLWKDLPPNDVLCLVPRPSTPAARDAKQLIVAWDRATSLPIAVVRDSTEGDRTIARLRAVEVGPLNDADRALVDLPEAAEGWTVDRRPLKP